MNGTTVENPRRQWLGIAAFYVASFGVLAIYMQFFPVWLHDERGLGEAQVTIVLSGQTVARTLAGPLWAQHVDRSGRPRAVLLWLAVLSLATFAGYAWAEQPLALFCCAFAFGCVYPPIHSILDAFALQTAQTLGLSYGRLRMVGSLSFLVVIVAVGWSLDAQPIALVYWLLLLGLGLTIAAGAVLPRPPALVPDTLLPRPRLRELLRPGPFLVLLVAAALIQGSHAPYYNLSTLHWRDHGVSQGLAGALWAEGILAEIVLFFVARSTFDRLRPTTLMMLGAAAAMVRWTVLALSTEVAVLAATNWLHALSFGCTYLGAIRALDRRVANNQRSTAQGLLGAASSGVGMVLASLLGGWLYERCGGFAFFAMVAFAAAGGLLVFLLRRSADRAQKLLNSTTSASPE